LEDEDLYRYARLVTSAVVAKIHTIDWTVQLLKTDTLLAGMRANWSIYTTFFFFESIMNHVTYRRCILTLLNIVILGTDY